MAWSPQARAAAIAARKRKIKGHTTAARHLGARYVPKAKVKAKKSAKAGATAIKRGSAATSTAAKLHGKRTAVTAKSLHGAQQAFSKTKRGAKIKLKASPAARQYKSTVKVARKTRKNRVHKAIRSY